MSNANRYEDRAWYQNPMVWLVIFFPAVAVVGGISTIFIAINTSICTTYVTINCSTYCWFFC